MDGAGGSTQEVHEMDRYRNGVLPGRGNVMT